MASYAQISKFIKEIAPDVQKAYKTLGKVKPSICIGMACVESGAGTSKIMYDHHALWGQKVGTGRTATKYWDGTFFTSKTKEEYTVGTHTIIKAAFRSYSSVLQGALNFYELLNSSLYKGVKSSSNYREQMKEIKACKYMTSSTEVDSVIWYIEKFDLRQYDEAPDIVKVDDNPYKITRTLLKVGIRGESVKWLQYELNKLGYTLAVDGVYGRLTKNAVWAYQTAHGLKIDGIAGIQTLKSLGANISLS